MPFNIFTKERMFKINNLILGNIIMFVACVIMCLAGLPKSKKATLTLQTIQIVIAGIGNLCLESYPGGIINFISAVRNILCQKGKLTTTAKIILGVTVTVISLLTNNLGGFVFFPLSCFIMFLFFMNTKDPVKLKWLIIIANILWGIHDVYVMAYTAVFFDVLGTITNLIGIYRIKKSKKDMREKEQE